MGKRKHKHKDKLEGTSLGIILIGIGIIALFDAWWPWILVVFGVAGLPKSIAEEGLWAGAQGFVWMIGLAILFATGFFWPGILILIGLSILTGALAKPPMLTDKPKRGVPPDEGYDF